MKKNISKNQNPIEIVGLEEQNGGIQLTSIVMQRPW